MLTSERLRQVLRYDPETGIFIWRKARQKVCVGGRAGGLSDKGYIRIMIDGKRYRAHRLAWLWMTGNWPPHEIDHRDLDKANNVWGNLRLANDTQQNGNKPLLRNNTSGYRGVSFDKRNKRWRAMIGDKNIGKFRTRGEAAAAYAVAARAYFGPFTRLG